MEKNEANTQTLQTNYNNNKIRAQTVQPNYKNNGEKMKKVHKQYKPITKTYLCTYLVCISHCFCNWFVLFVYFLYFLPIVFVSTQTVQTNYKKK